MEEVLRILMLIALGLTAACAPASRREAAVEAVPEEPERENASLDVCGCEAVDLMVERFTRAPGTVFVVFTTTLWARWLEGSWSQPIVPAC